MVNLRVEKFGVDSPTYASQNWYTFADFHISAPKQGLKGLLGGRTIYGHRLSLLVSSNNIHEKPTDPYITDDLFAKRLILSKFDNSRVKEYVQKKISEASDCDSVSRAFDLLEQSFEIDD